MKKLQPTLEALRKQGFKVRCTHYRYVFVNDPPGVRPVFVGDSPGLRAMREIKEWRQGGSQIKILPVGGKVVVVITTPEGKEVKAESNCSLADNFVRRIGTRMALGRALKALAQQDTTKAIVG